MPFNAFRSNCTNAKKCRENVSSHIFRYATNFIEVTPYQHLYRKTVGKPLQIRIIATAVVSHARVPRYTEKGSHRQRRCRKRAVLSLTMPALFLTMALCCYSAN